MNRWSGRRLLLTVAACAAAWAVVAVACLTVGSTGEIGWPGREVLRIRREYVLLASLIGAALASAGAAYQAILRNPLADPYLLGASTGATLAAYLWQFPAVTLALAVGEQAFAFAGALAAVGVVFAIASRGGRGGGRIEPITLLLVGVIVNAVNGSIFLLINAIIKDPATPGGPLAFLVGGLQTSLQVWQIALATTVIALGWLSLLYVAGQLNVVALGEAEAAALGVRVHRLRWGGLIVASLVTAAAVAISGPIGFIGLVCPHVARLFVGNDHRKLLPLATALGAILLCIADAASRWLARQGAAGTAMPVGVLTGLLGGPFFLLLLLRGAKRLSSIEGER